MLKTNPAISWFSVQVTLTLTEPNFNPDFMLTRWLFGIAVSFLMWFVPLVVVGQEIVTSRSESNNGLWGDGAPYPWYWDGVNQERGDPDNNATVANDILIGHNSNLSMTLNTRNYWARSLTFQSSATSPRTFGGN